MITPDPIQQIIDTAARSGMVLVRAADILTKGEIVMSFDDWLAQRNIDCQQLTPELQATLQAQYEADCQRAKPPGEHLTIPADCLWPARGYWSPVIKEHSV